MSTIKTLSRCLLVVLWLLCSAGIGQGWAVETIHDDWSFSQDIGLTSQGGFIKQMISGWGLETKGVTCTSSIMNSFQNVKGAMAINQVTGNLNNLASLVMVNQGPSDGTSLPKSPYFTNSEISNNVLRNYSSTYSAIIGGGSFQNSNAIMAVTQIAGNMNNISNVVGFSSQGAPSLSLSNALLSDVTASNNVYQNLGVTRASVEIQPDSFKGFNGVGSVIQASGNMIQIHSRVSVKVNQ